MEDVNLFMLASRWVHIVSAIVAIGGAAFMRFALVPGAARTLDDANHERLREAIRKRWAPFVHVSVALLLITGAINFAVLVILPKVPPLPYHAVFGMKFVAALVIFVVATALAGRSAAFARIRANNRAWLNTVLVLAAIIVLLSGFLNQIRTASSDRQAEPDPPTTAARPEG